MKRLLTTLIVVMVMMAGYSILAQTIVGSPHDFRAVGGNPNANADTVEICVFCHTPHNAIGRAGNATLGLQLIPLWNHTTTASAFLLYGDGAANTPSGSDLQGTVDSTRLGVSRACLSCHDGTLAIGDLSMLPYDHEGPPPIPFTYGGAEIDATGHLIGMALLGTDLTNDHPVAITYPDGTAGAGSDPDINPRAGIAPLRLLWDGATQFRVQCASCHDVHNKNAVAGTPLLRVTMSGSALCLTCHNK